MTLKGRVLTEGNHMEKSRWARRREALGKIKERRGCHLCGWNEFAAGLDFHHVRGPKGGTISSMIKEPYGVIVKELRKCVCLCAICHRGVHSGDVDMRYKKGMGIRASEQEIQWIK